MPISKHETTFFGGKIVDYVPNRKLAAKTVPRTHTDEHRSSEYLDAKETFASLRNDPLASKLAAIVIGPYATAWDGNASDVIKELTSAASKKVFTSLRAVFLGEITYEEQEISWIHVGNPGKILDAYPALECLRVRGTEEFTFKCAPHSALRTLTIESGGLNKKALKGVLSSSFEGLESLELWLGSEDYGADHRIDDLMPLLSGRLFPKLRHLGLRNCQYTDEIAVAIADAPVLKNLTSLDLSMGTLGDAGANALAGSPLVAKLESLDVSHHYMSTAVAKKLSAIGPKVVAKDRVEDEDEERYVQVGE
ncbi:MAG: STM4015 family protein [Myxococcales bacterium]|nr:STM4015 family protein [Myxococcales bacterium]